MQTHKPEPQTPPGEDPRAQLKMKGKPFDPIPRGKRAFEEVAAVIKEKILGRVWNAAERLPSETELASQFGVSPHTVREALRTLDLSGLIAIRAGVAGGPVVKDSIMASIGNFYLDAFQMEKMTITRFSSLPRSCASFLSPCLA